MRRLCDILLLTFLLQAGGLAAVAGPERGDPPPPPGDVLLFEDFASGLPAAWARFGNDHCCGVSLWAARTENGVPIMRSRWTNSPPPGQVARDLLATPAITLAGNSIVRFAAARSFDDIDHTSLYALWVARVDEASSQTDLAAYTWVETWSSMDFPLISEGWGVADVDLSDYDNEEVYIAFVHTQNDGDNFNLNYAFLTTEHAEAAVEPAALVIEVDPGQPTGQGTALVSNVAPSGAGHLAFEIPTAHVMAGTASSRAAAEPGPITLTHSDRTLVEDDVMACVIAGLGTRENHYWRVFDLTAFDVLGEVELSAVEIGIGSATVPQGALPTTVRLHRLEGELATENLTLLAEASYHVLEPHAGDTMVVTIPGGLTVDGGDMLVVEWHLTSGLPTGSFVFAGGNDAGQTGPTYHSSPECDLDQPTDLAELDAPDEHWVVDLHGTGTGVLALEPDQGTAAPGQSRELTAVADAAVLGEGAHHFEIRIRTNVPDQPALPLGVTVLVAPVGAEAAPSPRALELEQNHPNPFAGSTAIEYALQHPSDVALTVYDALGRRVATLVDAFHEAGRHEVVWDAGGLSPGVYVYRLQAGGAAASGRAVVIR